MIWKDFPNILLSQESKKNYHAFFVKIKGGHKTHTGKSINDIKMCCWLSSKNLILNYL